MNRVALYCRVSTKDMGQDTDNQLFQLRQLAQRRGWQIVHEYIDQASAKSSDREQFQAMFQDASRRQFDILLFWSLDRLSREGVYETLTHLQRLDSYGVAWKSYTEEYLDSTGMFKDAVIAILAAIAKQERIRLSERTKAGIERVRRNGSRWGRRPKQLDYESVAHLTLREAAKVLGCSHQSIKRHRKAIQCETTQ